MIIDQGQILNLETQSEDQYDLTTGLSAVDGSTIDTAWLTYTLKEAIHLSGGDHDTSAALFDEIHKGNEHSHWQWGRKIEFATPTGDMEYESFSMDIKGESQALMLIKYPHPSRCSAGINIVYVDYLQVAPWNLPHKYRAAKRYRGVGTIMLETARHYCQHLAEQYHYGFALHSLPQSEGYYRALGLNDLGPDSTYHSLTYFESNLEEV